MIRLLFPLAVTSPEQQPSTPEKAPPKNILTEALSGLKNLLDGVKNIVQSTRLAFAGLGESIFGKAASAKEKDKSGAELPAIEQVRKIIEANKENKAFFALAGKAWRTIQDMPEADLHGMDRVQLWTYMMALAEQESNYNPRAVNAQSKAFGLFQIMPANFREWGLVSGTSAGVEEQVRVAAKQLSGYYKHFGRLDLVSVSWFGGASRAVALQKGNTSVGNLKDSGGKSITAYHQDVAKRMERLQQA